MKHRRVILPVCMALLSCWLWPGMARAVDPAIAQPAQTVDGASAPTNQSAGGSDAMARPSVVAPARSQLDAEPIRRGETTSSATSISHPQGMELPRVGGALAIVIALIFLLRWGGKKLFNQGIAARSTRAVQVLARSTISPRQHIVLLRVGRRVIVVGEAGTQMTSLAEITDADEIASLLGQLQDEKTQLPSKAFSALFSRARHDIGGDADDEELASADEHGETEVTHLAVEESADDPAVSDTRDEINGLMDKIRVLSRHFRGQA